MRLSFTISLFLTLLGIDCIAQQTIHSSTHILNENEKIEPIDSSIVMNNALIISNDKFTFSFRHKRFELQTAEKVEEFISKFEINRLNEKVYIVCDTNSTYKSVVDILDIFLQSKILDYQLINYGDVISTELNKQDMSVIKEVSTSIPTFDTLSIEITKKDFIIKFEGQRKRFTTYKSLEKYLLENKLSLKKYNIELIASSDLKYRNYKPIIELLKALEIYDFNMNPK